MAKKKKESYFWTSYSDLMTNLFFVMLMLFVLTIALLHRQMVKIEKERIATQEQLNKIKELEKSIQNIDTTYFDYNVEYKTHILKTKVQFEQDKKDMNKLPPETKKELIAVRNMLVDSLKAFCEMMPNASYFLIIEGQASKEGTYEHNNLLSYERALALFEFWFPNQESRNLKIKDVDCEVIIAGAGCMEGKPREEDDTLNRRFLIRILPKPGMIGR